MKILKMENWFDCNKRNASVNVRVVCGGECAAFVVVGVVFWIVYYICADTNERILWNQIENFDLNGVERFGSNGFFLDGFE